VRIASWDGQQWRELLVAGTIGFRRLLRIAPVAARGFRYWVERSRGTPPISRFALYRRPLLLAAPVIERDRHGLVTIEAEGADVHYTVDGTAPTANSPRYRGPLQLPRGGLVAAISRANPGRAALAQQAADVTTAVFGLAPAGLTLLECSSQQAPGEAATRAFDGNPLTHWHSRWSPDSPRPPHHLAVDLGEVVTVTGFVYLPRAVGDNGTVADYEFQVRGNADDPWRTVAAGSFTNDPAGARRVVYLDSQAVGVRAVRFLAHRELRDRAWASCAEFEVLVLQ